MQKEIFNQTFEEFPFKIANKISQQDDENDLILGGQFTYGEIEFDTFEQIFNIINPYIQINRQQEQIFYDLGSGTGKACVAACLLRQNFTQIIGIELLKSLHETALSIIEKASPEYPQFNKIKYINDDFLKFDWKNADILFVNATCYEKEFMQQLYEKANQMKKGSIFIVTTQKFENQANFWEQIASFKSRMSWGNANINIYLKIN